MSSCVFVSCLHLPSFIHSPVYNRGIILILNTSMNTYAATTCLSPARGRTSLTREEREREKGRKEEHVKRNIQGRAGQERANGRMSNVEFRLTIAFLVYLLGCVCVRVYAIPCEPSCPVLSYPILSHPILPNNGQAYCKRAAVQIASKTPGKGKSTASGRSVVEEVLVGASWAARMAPGLRCRHWYSVTATASLSTKLAWKTKSSLESKHSLPLPQ
jgi:hypothetical protein